MRARYLQVLAMCVYGAARPAGPGGTECRDEPPSRVAGSGNEKGGQLVVKVPNGTTYQPNENQPERHGHAMPKAGTKSPW